MSLRDASIVSRNVATSLRASSILPYCM